MNKKAEAELVQVLEAFNNTLMRLADRLDVLEKRHNIRIDTKENFDYTFNCGWHYGRLVSLMKGEDDANADA